LRTSDAEILQRFMSDSSSISQVDLYGDTTFRGIVFTASNKDGSYKFQLNQHNFKSDHSIREWMVPEGSFISKLEADFDGIQISWLRFTVNTG
jgi:hypothetical protein